MTNSEPKMYNKDRNMFGLTENIEFIKFLAVY